MFGYIVVDKPDMYIKDFTMYKAFYCGFCKGVGKRCSQLMRFTTNYDMTFFDILLHSVYGREVVISNEACVLNPIKKKSICVHDDLSAVSIDINTILLHYKLRDDVYDSGSCSGRFIDSAVIRRHYKAAAKRMPQADKVCSDGYKELRRLEGERCPSLDAVAHPFADMMRSLAEIAFGDKYDDSIGELMYNLGRWVYFCDALDDIDDDFKDKTYNPFLIDYDYKSREQFIKERGAEAEFALRSAYKAVCDAFAGVSTPLYEGVLTNIIWYGLLSTTNKIIGGCKVAKRSVFRSGLEQ